MGQALYREYRPKSLGEIVGQEHITATLANALKSGRINHAYLLSGPRGTGKTSIARILAHEINDLPYTDEAHLDIIEIDAASNRRIDEIRDLRDRVNTAPARAKYKVYIIDEVHMLTKEAFNALLKTLEEPPAHVIFILATTEAHKLPETIVSRTQRYSLRPVVQELVIQHLRKIADSEKIVIDDDALVLIAEHGEGSFRDSISLLDQASSTKEHVTRADVEGILGLAPDEYIAKLVIAMTNADSISIVTTLADLYAQGFEAAMIAQQLGATTRSSILDGHSPDPAAGLHLLANLLDIPGARNPRQLLEIVLLQSTLPATTHATTMPVQSATSTKVTPTIPKPKPIPATDITLEDKPETRTADDKPKTEEPTDSPADKATAEVTEASPANPDTIDAIELWHQALEAIKKQYNTLYGIARMAHPTFDGQKLTLAFKFAFHQKRVNEAKNRELLATVVANLYGQPVEISCVIIEGEPEIAKPDVSTISNIFGGAELLES